MRFTIQYSTSEDRTSRTPRRARSPLGRGLAAVALLAVSSSATAVETIELRSGNGASGGPDGQITLLVGPPFSGFAAVTATEFDAASNGSAATIHDPFSGWLTGLPCDPAAQWVGNPNRDRTVLLAHSFMVQGDCIQDATLEFCFAVDNDLGTASQAGLYLNGSPITGSQLTGATTANFGLEHTATYPVTDLLVQGLNTLHVNVVNAGGAAGVIYSAVLDIEAPSHPSLCFGNGGVTPGCTPCPCGNDGPPESRGGCTNASGRNAKLLASGDASPSGDTLRFDATGLDNETFAVLLSGSSVQPINPGNPCFALQSGVQSNLLDGLRCIGGSIGRYGARISDFEGNIGFTNPGWGYPDPPVGGLLAAAGAMPGQVIYYQLFYRTPPIVCGTQINTSQAVCVLVTL